LLNLVLISLYSLSKARTLSYLLSKQRPCIS